MTAVERQSRAAKQERETAAKLKADMLAAKQAKAALVASMAAGSGGSGSGGICGDDGGDNGGDNGGDDSNDDDSDYEPSLQGASEDEMSEDDEAADHLPRREVRPDDVHAELDEDEQLDGSEAEPGVMGTYLKAVFDRLHSEVCGKASRCALEDKWLLGLLKAPGADWWLRAGLAESVCAKLGLEFSQPSYYRDIYVWLPDMRWGHEAMPPCVECETAAQVGPHCFRDNHFARRIGVVLVCGIKVVWVLNRFHCSGPHTHCSLAERSFVHEGLPIAIGHQMSHPCQGRGLPLTTTF